MRERESGQRQSVKSSIRLADAAAPEHRGQRGRRENGVNMFKSRQDVKRLGGNGKLETRQFWRHRHETTATSRAMTHMAFGRQAEIAEFAIPASGATPPPQCLTACTGGRANAASRC